MLTRGSCAAASSAYDKMISSDGRFFARRPHRRLRIRRAHGSETADCEQIPPGLRWFAVTRYIRSGIRIRMFIAASPGLATDINDSEIEFLLASMGPLARLLNVLRAERVRVGEP
jgi:hypothetical protein